MKQSAMWILMMVAGIALAGCDKEPAAGAAGAAGTAGTAGAAGAAGAAGGLPEACEAYLKRATACYDKAGTAAAQMKQSMEQVRAGWKAVPDPSQLEASCKIANEQFAQTATALGCE